MLCRCDPLIEYQQESAQKCDKFGVFLPGTRYASDCNACVYTIIYIANDMHQYTLLYRNC